MTGFDSIERNIVELSKESKIAIIKRQIDDLDGTIYQLTVQAKVAVNIGDEIMKKQTTEQLVKLEKAKVEYEKILTEETQDAV